MDALRNAYAGHPYHALAEVFREAWQRQGDVSSACDAARVYAEAHPEVLAAFGHGDYGYGNPSYTLNEICCMRVGAGEGEH